MPPPAHAIAPYVSLGQDVYIHKPHLVGRPLSESKEGENRLSEDKEGKEEGEENTAVSVEISEGKEKNGGGKVPPPDVVLIFGWAGAKLPHLQKYTKIYDEIYPSATKLLVRSEMASFLRFESTNIKRLEPVVSVLEAQHAALSHSPRILVHVFSNGGCWQVKYLNSALRLYGRSRSSSPSSPALTPSEFSTATTMTALILDSCPGGATVSGAKQAVRPFLTFPPLRWLIYGVVHLLYGFSALKGRAESVGYGVRVLIGKVLRRLLVKLFLLKPKTTLSGETTTTTVPKRYTGIPPSIRDMQLHMSRVSPLPFIDASTPRLYLYSDADTLIKDQEVEAHVKETRAVVAEALFDKSVAKEQDDQLNAVEEIVRAVKFEGSPHVAHARTYPERYWSEVKAVWERANTIGGS